MSELNKIFWMLRKGKDKTLEIVYSWVLASACLSDNNARVPRGGKTHSLCPFPSSVQGSHCPCSNPLWYFRPSSLPAPSHPSWRSVCGYGVQVVFIFNHLRYFLTVECAHRHLVDCNIPWPLPSCPGPLLGGSLMFGKQRWFI